MTTLAVNVEWEMMTPLLILAGTGCLILLLAGGSGSRKQRLPFLLALLGLVAALGSSLGMTGDHAQVSALGGMLVMDQTAVFMSTIVLLAALLGVFLSRQYLERAPAPAPEYYALILFAALGMVVMASTNNLLVMFVGLEVLSVALYVLAGITRDWLYSLEASLKYFLLGAFSTGFILYGVAFLYGATGTLDLMIIGQTIGDSMSGGGTAMLLVGLGLMIVGLAFKVAAVPFHWWVPDVYEGTPTPVTAFMAVGTKGVAFVALLRLVEVAFGQELVSRWSLTLGVLALLSMVVGNMVALTQRNVKRLLAYSSVAHAGYLLVAMAAGSDLGTRALLFYFASYLLTTLGAFGIASLVAETGPRGDEGYGLLRFYGLGRSHPGLALAMSIFMVSLIGIPPTSGFVGKYFIFQAAMERGLSGDSFFLVLAVLGILTSVISAAYYLRVIVAMYMQEPDGAPTHVRTGLNAGFAVAVTAVGVVLLGLFPTPVYDLTRNLHAALQSMALYLWF